MREDIVIDGRMIGTGHRPYIVAELSGNHNQSIERALKLIDAAADAGADGALVVARRLEKGLEVGALLSRRLEQVVFGRREFRLGQQTAGWQSSLNFAAEVQPLARAMGEAAIPQELRALMLDKLDIEVLEEEPQPPRVSKQRRC